MDKLTGHWRLCGTDWDDYGKKGWRSCRGTWPGQRGYTCGLWMLLHALAAHTTDTTALSDFQAMREWIWYFFGCKDCRHHFFNITVYQEDARNRSSLQLWLWNAHNKVNLRVGQNEKENAEGDPLHPKVLWPTTAQCRGCWSESSDEGAFLEQAEESRWLGGSPGLLQRLNVTVRRRAAERYQEGKGSQMCRLSSSAGAVVSDMDRDRGKPKPLSKCKAGDQKFSKRVVRLSKGKSWNLLEVRQFLDGFYHVDQETDGSE